MIGLLAVIFVTFALMRLTFAVYGLLIMLTIAGICGAIADAIVPGSLPFGWLGAVAAGLLGSALGTLILGPIGPNLFGVQIIPAILGAIVIALAAELVLREQPRPP